MGRSDEYNDYGIGNPDGIQSGFTDFSKLSFDNDTKLSLVKELPEDKVTEISSYDEYPILRKNDAPKQNDLVAKAQSSSSQDAVKDAASKQNVTTNVAQTTTQATAAATTTATAATTTAAATVSAVSVSGIVATTVVTVVMVATVVANALAFAVSFISSTFNSLSFEIALEQTEEGDVYTAVLYDSQDKVVESRTITQSQIIVFENLEEGHSYTFVVYDKDNIVQFKNTYLTSSRRGDEDKIKITLNSYENGVLSFDLFVPQSLAKNLYTLRVSDVKGKQLYVTDDVKESTNYILTNMPQDNGDLIITVSISNKVVYQYRVTHNEDEKPEEDFEFNNPTFLWDEAQSGVIPAVFVSKLDPSKIERVNGTYADIGTRIEPTFEEDGQVSSLAQVDFMGRHFTSENTSVLPALINFYTFVDFVWENGDYFTTPTVSALFTRNSDSAEYRVPVSVKFENEYTTSANVHKIEYSVLYTPAGREYSDEQALEFTNYELRHEDDLNYLTGVLTAHYYVDFDGLDETYETQATIEEFNLSRTAITYDLTFRGDSLDYTIASVAVRTFNFDGINIMFDESLQDATITYFGNANNIDEIPETILGVPLNTIGNRAFKNTEITEITIPSTITNFNEYCFSESNLETIEFETPIEEVSNGMFANSSNFKLDVFLASNSASSIVVVGSYAFAGTTLSEDASGRLVIPDTVSTLGEYAFANNERIESILTQANITAIPEGTFSGCTFLHAASVLEVLMPVSIGASAFANTNATDTTLEIPSTVNYIGDGAFAGLSGLNSVTLYFTGNTPTSEYQYKHFGRIFGTEEYTSSVAISQNDGTNSYYTYYIPTYLNEIVFEGQSVLSYSFYGMKGKDLYAVDGFTFEMDYADEIGAYAFADSQIKEFRSTLYEQYAPTSIKEGAFKGATLLDLFNGTSDYNLDFHCVSEIGALAFERTHAESVLISDDVEEIGQGAFGRMAQLESITTPFLGGDSNGTADDYVNYFGYIFSQTQQDDAPYVLNGPNNHKYYMNSGLNINFTGTTIEDYALSGALDHIAAISFGENLTSIGDYAFFDTKISSGDVLIPNTVTSIGDYAFAADSYEIVSMMDIAFEEDGTEPLTFGERVFSKNGNMTAITLPTRTVSIGEGAIEYCMSLESYSAPFVGLGDISIADAHYSYLSLVSTEDSHTTTANPSVQADITVPDNYNPTSRTATTSTTMLCYWPKLLKTLKVTGGKVHDYAFNIKDHNDSTKTLVEAVQIENVSAIGCYAFAETRIGSTVVNPEDPADTTFTTQISIDFDALTQVGEYAFANSKFESFVIGANLTYIGKNAFFGASTASNTAPSLTYDTVGLTGNETWDVYDTSGAATGTTVTTANIDSSTIYDFSIQRQS